MNNERQEKRNAIVIVIDIEQKHDEGIMCFDPSGWIDDWGSGPNLLASLVLACCKVSNDAATNKANQILY